MKCFGDKISLVKNGRGCYILDTVKGCSAITKKTGGCYGDCYANRIASRYKIIFDKPVSRMFVCDKIQPSLFGFIDSKHLSYMIKQIRKIDMPFIRIGDMGDPSEDWNNTIDVCEKIKNADKSIVIITKHWNPIDLQLCKKLEKLNVCINTSISAMDSESELEYRIEQYEKLKNYCRSVLRVVSCDFNTSNEVGAKMKDRQDFIFSKYNVLDTVFRPSVQNQFVTNKIINVEKAVFIKSRCLVSLRNKNAYLGDCKHCPDLCGMAVKYAN